MKKFSKKMYGFLSTAAMFVAVTSIAQLNSFCILTIHQPEIPDSLKKKAGIIKND
nr:cyclic lactone autoinducer peptide [uncultured Clostridium sp.]